jgi:hypothetical protein
MARELTVVKNKPELVEVKNRSVSAYGFRHTLMNDHLQQHLESLRKQWCEVGCLARTMFQRNSEANRKQVRQRMAGAFRWFLDRGIFLVIDYEIFGNGHHGEMKAIKIYQPSAQLTIEFESAQSQVKRMLRRREISQERYDKAVQLIKVGRGQAEEGENDAQKSD